MIRDAGRVDRMERVEGGHSRIASLGWGWERRVRMELRWSSSAGGRERLRVCGSVGMAWDRECRPRGLDGWEEWRLVGAGYAGGPRYCETENPCEKINHRAVLAGKFQ